MIGLGKMKKGEERAESIPLSLIQLDQTNRDGWPFRGFFIGEGTLQNDKEEESSIL